MTEIAWQKSACILCECNCGIEVQVEGRSLNKIRGDKSHVGSEGYTCEKALRLDHYQSRTTRLTSPLRRRADGTYEEIEWDTAIGEIAARLRAIRDQHGGEPAPISVCPSIETCEISSTLSCSTTLSPTMQ